MSQVFERILHAQTINFMENKFSALLTSFSKNHSTQNCLVSRTENWKNSLDKDGFIATIFMDLTMAVDILTHNLLIAKLGAYEFRKNTLTYMKN